MKSARFKQATCVTEMLFAEIDLFSSEIKEISPKVSPVFQFEIVYERKRKNQMKKP